MWLAPTRGPGTRATAAVPKGRWQRGCARPWVVTSANARVQELDHPTADVPDELRPDEMKDCRVHLAKVNDAGVLAELIAAFSGDQGDAAAVAQRILTCATTEVALLAETPQGIDGFACLRVVPAVADRFPHALLTELFVRPGRRRLGIGRDLVHAAEARARERGATALWLFTGRENYAAQNFYQSLGYGADMLGLRKPF